MKYFKVRQVSPGAMFPIDMLRRTPAWPKEQIDSERIYQACQPRSSANVGEIVLVTHTNIVPKALWYTFGWEVL